MGGLGDLAREYEAKRFPLTHRLDLHAEGPAAARERALHWIQSYAHEAPGSELLLIVERVARHGRPAGPLRRAIEKLLDELVGGLIDWWAPFDSGSLALRIAALPRFSPPPRPLLRAAPDDGRTHDTAGAVPIRPELDIPEELISDARRVAELRRERERLSLGLSEVVLRRIWIEAQATAMNERIGFDTALERLLLAELAAAYDDHA